MELGVLTLHGRIRHSQTQVKDESFNRSMTRELLRYATIENKTDAQSKFEQYRSFYNYERPHFALGLDTPAKHYTTSEQSMPQMIRDWEYPAEYELRKINFSTRATPSFQN